MEFLAVLMAIQRWKHYLQSHKFIIRTDQQSVKYLLNQKTITLVQQRWITKLLGLNYEIQYKNDTENIAVDAISRVQNITSSCDVMTAIIPSWLQDVMDSYDGDEWITKIKTEKSLKGDSWPLFLWMGSSLDTKAD